MVHPSAYAGLASLLEHAPLNEQIVIGFDEKLGLLAPTDAQETIDEVLSELQKLGATKLKSFVAKTSDAQAFFAVAVVSVNNPTLMLAHLRQLLRDKDNRFLAVSHFESNARVSMAGFDDPLLAQQWALPRLGVDGVWSRLPPGAPAKTVVAIVDSGLRRPDGTVHADLGAVEPVADCQPPDLCPDNVDADGHGTCLAGTIAAVPGNDTGVSSAIPVEWNISLLPVKFFTRVEPPTAVDGAIGIAHAVDEGAKVINVSWHVAPCEQNLKTLRSAIRFARKKKRLVVMAAGNDGTDNEVYPVFPANFANLPKFQGRVLTVLATDRHDAKATFSNYGMNTIDIGAPGLRILTTARYLVDPPRYAQYSGTSPAAAYASAGAALVFALHPANWDGAGAPAWEPKDVVQHLKASADTIGVLKHACIGGKRLNLKRAVYGPLRITAPADGATLVIGAQNDIKWDNIYDNPKFDKVKIEFSLDDGANYTVVVDASASNDGLRKWEPAVAHATTTGRIKITPTRGNFPVVSKRFKVA